MKSNSLNINLSYNYIIGGETANMIIDMLGKFPVNIIKTDYRKIKPLMRHESYSMFLESIKDLTDLTASKVWSESLKKANNYLNSAHALIIPGNSADVEPKLYGNNTQHKLKTDLERAIAEMTMIEVALQRGMPILGICGGHQLINVYLGGVLKNHPHTHNTEITMLYPYELAQIISPKTLSNVTSKFVGIHQQVVEKIGGNTRILASQPYFAISAYDEINKNIEAVESLYGAPIWGMQFHPEYYNSFMSEGIKIFRAFIQATSAYKAKQDAAFIINILGRSKKKQPELTVRQLVDQYYWSMYNISGNLHFSFEHYHSLSNAQKKFSNNISLSIIGSEVDNAGEIWIYDKTQSCFNSKQFKEILTDEEAVNIFTSHLNNPWLISILGEYTQLSKDFKKSYKYILLTADFIEKLPIKSIIKLDIKVVQEIENIIRNIISNNSEKTNTIASIISPTAIGAYESGYVNPQDIAISQLEKRRLLLTGYKIKCHIPNNYNAKLAYEYGAMTSSDLVNISIEKIKLLISLDAIELYKAGIARAADFYNLECEQITLLTSCKILQLCQEGKLEFAKIKNLPIAELLQIIESCQSKSGDKAIDI